MVGVVVRRPGGAGDVDAGGTPSSGHGEYVCGAYRVALSSPAWRRSSRLGGLLLGIFPLWEALGAKVLS